MSEHSDLGAAAPPSPWVVRHAAAFAPGASVVDLACGSGRHARFLAAAGHSVVAVDRDAEALASLAGVAGVTSRIADLEGETWPLGGAGFAGVVVSNYLWRSRLDDVLGLLAPGGILIYETFMAGNERYGKPSRPDFLLASQELLRLAARHGLTVLAYEEGYCALPKPAMRQALCARRPG
jgi:SAM-dependent methyltransferase